MGQNGIPVFAAQGFEKPNIIRRAVKQAGGPKVFGQMVAPKVTPQTVCAWEKTHCLPLEHLPTLAAHSSYTVRELADDIAEHHPRFRALVKHIGPGRARDASKRSEGEYRPTIDPRQIEIAAA